MKVVLPSFFSFRHADDLVRVGKDNDGGYLVSLSDIKNSKFLISFGISDDWSFESHFIKLNDVEVFAYDASVNFKFFLKKLIFSLMKNPLNFSFIKKYFLYRKFFKGKNYHVKKFVGINSNQSLFISMRDILKKKFFSNVFFKIDIEGAEYRLLDELIENENKISGLVIEFHDVDLHLEKIEKFIKNFRLKLVHIHANNFGFMRSDDRLPQVLELTFSKYSELKDNSKLPHELDMPNDKNQEEYFVSISNFIN